MKTADFILEISKGKFDQRFTELYGEKSVSYQRRRYTDALNGFDAEFGKNREVRLFSVPGRSEISGNHTDHNGGCVIAAAVDPDIIAVASANDRNTVTVKSEGFGTDTVSCFPDKPDETLFYTSGSLISGMCAGFANRGYSVHGYDAYMTSNVLKGSGLSSSAAFEVMIGTIMNYLYNGGSVSAPVVAEIAQFAENKYFGKPSGLMDQTACAVGGFSFIDFENPKAAVIEKLDFDMGRQGYSLCITNTGGNHADLNDDYASVPAEMKAVAAEFGKPVLRGLTEDMLISRIPELREKVGDRAILRAFHFINENERVGRIAGALRNGDINGFLEGIRASGRSSFMWLQNVYAISNPSEQGLSLALAVTEYALSDTDRLSAWRIHGGGFAGTVQAFVPNEDVLRYKEIMENVFGAGSCAVLKVRGDGASEIL